MVDGVTQMWVNEIQRKLILSSVVGLAAFVLGRVLPTLAVNPLPDDSSHIYVIRMEIGNWLCSFHQPCYQGRPRALQADWRRSRLYDT